MSEYFNTKRIKEEEAVSFILHECFEEIDPKKEREFWIEKEAENCKVAELAKERVEKIYQNYIDEDTEIHIVTARKGYLFEVTKEWLKKTGLKYHSLHCVGWQSKIEWALEELPQVDAIFEDNPSLFLEAYEKGYDEFFDLYRIEYPYNEGLPAHYILDKETGNELF